MKTKFFEIFGFYGSEKTKTDIFCAFNGGTWYVCKGSQTVNYTPDKISNRVNIEKLKCTENIFTGRHINSLKELETAINKRVND